LQRVHRPGVRSGPGEEGRSDHRRRILLGPPHPRLRLDRRRAGLRRPRVPAAEGDHPWPRCAGRIRPRSERRPAMNRLKGLWARLRRITKINLIIGAIAALVFSYLAVTAYFGTASQVRYTSNDFPGAKRAASAFLRL